MAKMRKRDSKLKLKDGAEKEVVDEWDAKFIKNSVVDLTLTST